MLLFTRLFRPAEYRADIYNPESFEQQQDRSSAIPITSVLSECLPGANDWLIIGASYFQSTRDGTTFIPPITTTTMVIIYSRNYAERRIVTIGLSILSIVIY